MSRLFHADSQRAAPAPRRHTGDPPGGTLPLSPSPTLSQWEMRLRPVVGCRYLDGNAACSAQGYLSIKGLGSRPAPWAWGLPALCAGCSSGSPMGGQSRGLGCKARAPVRTRASRPVARLSQASYCCRRFHFQLPDLHNCIGSIDNSTLWQGRKDHCISSTPYQKTRSVSLTESH